MRHLPCGSMLGIFCCLVLWSSVGISVGLGLLFFNPIGSVGATGAVIATAVVGFAGAIVASANGAVVVAAV